MLQSIVAESQVKDKYLTMLSKAAYMPSKLFLVFTHVTTNL